MWWPVPHCYQPHKHKSTARIEVTQNSGLGRKRKGEQKVDVSINEVLLDPG